MIPFVLVGLFLIGWAGHQFRATFNPTIELTLDRAEAAPGDRVQLTWQIGGAVSRLKKLTIRLVGTEAATYRGGTTTVTDRHELRNVVVYESGIFGSTGNTNLDIPSDVMHSFQSNNNRIEWKLKVQGLIASWPDLDLEYLLVVAPKGMKHG